EETARDEEGEVGVDVAGVLEHPIQAALHLLPDGVAGRLDDHAAAHGAVVGQFGAFDDIEIPLRVILGAGGDRIGGHAKPSAREWTRGNYNPSPKQRQPRGPTGSRRRTSPPGPLSAPERGPGGEVRLTADK